MTFERMCTKKKISRQILNSAMMTDNQCGRGSEWKLHQ